jgi:hypothetical protein
MAIYLIPILLGSIVLVAIYIKHGIFFTFDSGNYWVATLNLADSLTLIDMLKQPMVLLPPLYSVILTICTPNPDFLLPVLHLALFLGNSFFIYKLTEHLISEKNIQFIAFTSISLSVQMFSNYLFVWSESLFMLLLLSAIYFYFKSENANKKAYLYIALILFSLLPLSRIVGLVFCGIFILYQFRNGIKNMVISVIVILPFSIWILRNYIETNRFLNEYDAAAIPFMLNLEESSTLVWKYFSPDFFISNYLKIAFLIAVLLYLIFKSIKGAKEINFLSVQALSFFLFLLISNTLKTIFRFDDRYLLPFYILLLLLFFVEMGNIALDSKFKKTIIYASVFLSLYSLSRTVNNVRLWYHSAAGYTASVSEKNEIIKYIDASKPLYSNEAAKMIAFTYKKCYYISDYSITQFNKDEVLQLVWFNKIDYDYSVNLENIIKNFELIQKKETETFTVYILKTI